MSMFKQLLLNTAILTLSTLLVCSMAHAWSEPPIAPVMMTAPLTPPPVTGTTFYVDKNSFGGTCNNNNPGTQTQPWCTIGKAMATLTAGQQVLIRAGTYTEGNLIPANSGTPGNYITFRRYPGENPALDCTGYTWCFNQYDPGTGRSYIVIDGLDISHPRQEMISQGQTASHHWWFVNNKIHDNRPGTPDSNAGFPCLRLQQSNNVVSNNEGYNCRANFAGIGGNGGNSNIVEFNLIHDNGRHVDDDGGVKCAPFGWACVLRYNIAYNNWRDPASPRPCDANPCLGVTGLYLDLDRSASHGTLSYVYNNVSHDNDTGIQVYESEGTRVFNNVSYHNGFTPGDGTFHISNFGHGFFIGQTYGIDIQVYNNVSYNNRERGFHLGGIPAAQLTLRNNIAMNNDINISHFFAANANFNYDLIGPGRSGTAIIFNGTNYASLAAFLARPGNTTWLNGVGTSATFVNAVNGNFHLQTGSAGINQGTTGFAVYDLENVTRPQGQAFDIGAYEYGSGNLSLSPPTNLRVVP